MAKIKPVAARITLRSLRPAIRKALEGIRGRQVRKVLRGRIEPKKPKGVRWGRVAEINYLMRIGSKPWLNQPQRLQNLHAWRADHAVVPNHLVVRRFARKEGVKPSSDISIPQKVAFFQKHK